MKRMRSSTRQRGTSMIEILVTLVIIAFGLLGMAGLQARLQVSEMESYQRSQALLLLNDMANRIATNRSTPGSYVTGTTYGDGMTCPTASSTVAERDLKEWCAALQGAGEATGTLKQGAMIGGRGCISLVDGDYVVSVAWQGLTPISAPASTCGATQYDNGGTCVNDLCRRVVTTVVRIGGLL